MPSSYDFVKTKSKSALEGHLKASETEDIMKWRKDLLDCVVSHEELEAWEASGGGDHGSLSGLTDDDHTQYLLASDATSRAFFASSWTVTLSSLEFVILRIVVLDCESKKIFIGETLKDPPSEIVGIISKATNNFKILAQPPESITSGPCTINPILLKVIGMDITMDTMMDIGEVTIMGIMDTQITTIKTDNSGKMFIHYWMNMDPDLDSLLLTKLGIFNKDSLSNIFTQDFTQLNYANVYHDYGDSSLHAQIEFEF